MDDGETAADRETTERVMRNWAEASKHTKAALAEAQAAGAETFCFPGMNLCLPMKVVERIKYWLEHGQSAKASQELINAVPGIDGVTSWEVTVRLGRWAVPDSEEPVRHDREQMRRDRR